MFSSVLIVYTCLAHLFTGLNAQGGFSLPNLNLNNVGSTFRGSGDDSNNRFGVDEGLGNNPCNFLNCPEGQICNTQTGACGE